MKNLNTLLIMTLVLTSVLWSCKSQKEVENKKMDLNLKVDSASYSIGVQIAETFVQQGFDSTLNIDAVVAGLKEHIAKEGRIKIEETDKIIQSYMSEMQKSQSKDKITEGEDFLKENAKKEGVITTESGLQYEVLTMGTGEKPTATSTVKTHYEGRLLNGTVFDSSYDRGEPISFPLQGVIKGWTEGLQLMPVGSKFRFYVPYNLAYGERGAGKLIGPFETLIFDVELLEIEK